MTDYSQKEFQFPDSRSAQELATAIWNYELLPARDFNNVKGERIHCAAKKLAHTLQDEGSLTVGKFRHAIFTIMQNAPEASTRRGVENAFPALEELANIYDKHASEFRRLAQVEFLDTPDGPVGRHNADMAADINDAENSTTIARKLRDDKELHNLVQALAKKLDITLTPKERTR